MHDQFELRNAHPEKSEISSAGTPRNALVHQGGAAAEARTDAADAARAHFSRGLEMPLGGVEADLQGEIESNLPRVTKDFGVAAYKKNQ